MDYEYGVNRNMDMIYQLMPQLCRNKHNDIGIA
ncbi:hypothetical protein AB210_0734 [Acinetobacter baumannii AB210]|nr:hypothetical protein AB210_0734 [Acinetobacter baumannii AB210]